MRNRLTLDELETDFCTKLCCKICFISSTSASSCACTAAVFSAHISILNAMRLSNTVHVTNNKQSCKQNFQKYTLCPAATLQS